MVNILKLQQRTMRYEFADGIRDFQTALWLLLMGFYVWFFWGMPGVWRPVVDSARSAGDFVLLVLILGFFGLPILIFQASLSLMNTHVRRRWLWRETGFIKPKSWPVPRKVVLVALTITGVISIGGGLVGIQFNSGGLMVRMLYLGTAVGMGVMYFWMGHRLQLPRYQWVAVAGLAGTLVIILLPLNGPMCGFLAGVYWAAVLTISGTYALIQMAKQQRPSDDAA